MAPLRKLLFLRDVCTVNLQYQSEISLWNSMGEDRHRQLDNHHKRIDSSLSRSHASAPCLLNMTYEVPIKDKDDERTKRKQTNSSFRKSSTKIPPLSFHG